MDSKDFLEQSPQLFGSDTIAYLNDLECYVDGEITIPELEVKQPRTQQMYPTTIEKVYRDGRMKFVSVCNPRHNEQAPYIPLENVSVHQRELQHIPYRWVNEKGKPDSDGEIFEVFYRNKWREGSKKASG